MLSISGSMAAASKKLSYRWLDGPVTAIQGSDVPCRCDGPQMFVGPVAEGKRANLAQTFSPADALRRSIGFLSMTQGSSGERYRPPPSSVR
jgi:hypothetical protein